MSVYVCVCGVGEGGKRVRFDACVCLCKGGGVKRVRFDACMGGGGVSVIR